MLMICADAAASYLCLLFLYGSFLTRGSTHVLLLVQVGRHRGVLSWK